MSCYYKYIFIILLISFKDFGAWKNTHSSYIVHYILLGETMSQNKMFIGIRDMIIDYFWTLDLFRNYRHLRVSVTWGPDGSALGWHEIQSQGSIQQMSTQQLQLTRQVCSFTQTKPGMMQDKEITHKHYRENNAKT